MAHISSSRNTTKWKTIKIYSNRY